jgi:hypothetical protein
MTRMLVKIMMELTTVFGITTKEVNLKEGPLSEPILTNKFPSNVALLSELRKETTGRKRHQDDPTEAGSARSGGGEEDNRADS